MTGYQRGRRSEWVSEASCLTAVEEAFCTFLFSSDLCWIPTLVCGGTSRLALRQAWADSLGSLEVFRRKKSMIQWHLRLLVAKKLLHIISKEENIKTLQQVLSKGFFSGLIKHIAQELNIVYIEEVLLKVSSTTSNQPAPSRDRIWWKTRRLSDGNTAQNFE